MKFEIFEGSFSAGWLAGKPDYRSRLYRSQILQLNPKNIRWKALDEIYKMYMLFHRSGINILAIFVEFVGVFKNRNVRLSWNLLGFSRIFSDFLEKRCNYSKFLDFNLISAYSVIIVEIHLIFDLILHLIFR